MRDRVYDYYEKLREAMQSGASRSVIKDILGAARRRFEILGDYAWFGQVTLQLVEFLFRDAEMQEIKAVLEEALRNYATKPKDVVYASLTCSMGVFYHYTRQNSAAESCYLQALSYSIQKGCTMRSAEISSNLAAFYFDSNQYAKALEFGNKCLALFPYGGNFRDEPPERLSTLTATRILLTEDGFREVQEPCSSVLAGCYLNIGNTLMRMGDYSTAIDSFGNSLAFARTSKSIYDVPVALNQLGETALLMKDYEKAAAYFVEAEQIFLQHDIKGNLLAAVRTGLGKVLFALSEYSEAQKSLSLALEGYREVNDTRGESEALLHYAEVLMGEGQMDPAFSYVERALQLAKQVHVAQVVIKALRILAKIDHPAKKQSPLESFMQALLLADEHSLRREQADIHRDLASYYKLQGETAQALSHFEQYHKIERELLNESARRDAENLAILHEVEKYKSSAEKNLQRLQTTQEELKRKTNELAEFAKSIVEKQEYLERIEQALQRILAARPNEKDSFVLKLLSDVQSGSSVSEDLSKFKYQFNLMQQDFVRILAQEYPDLTPAELKICALLRMNLRTKDIAEMMHLSTKTIENHRLHLRQKFNLPRETALITALMELETRSINNNK